MASYQDLESRVISLENMLKFVMERMHMRASVTNGLVDSVGNPQVSRTFEGSLLELYHLSNQVDEVVNG